MTPEEKLQAAIEAYANEASENGPQVLTDYILGYTTTPLNSLDEIHYGATANGPPHTSLGLLEITRDLLDL